MSGRGLLGLVVGLVLVASSAPAQEGGSRSHRSQERREGAFRMVDAYVIANIQDSLELTDAEYEKVIPLVNKLQKSRREFHHQRSKSLRHLRHLLSSGTASESEVQEALETFKTVDREGPETVRSHMEALDAVLSPLQQAKYRIFELEVEARMRRLMRRGRGDGRRGSDGGGDRP